MDGNIDQHSSWMPMMQSASFATAAGREIDLVRDFPSGKSAPQEE